MPTHSALNPDVQGSFEVTLARDLNMARKRLPIQTAISKHKRRFFSLADHQRQELASIGSTVDAALGSATMRGRGKS